MTNKDDCNNNKWLFVQTLLLWQYPTLLKRPQANRAMDKILSCLKKCFAIKPWERVLILTDTKMSARISEAFLASSKKLPSNAIRLAMKPVNRDGEEPPASVAGAMMSADVIIMLTANSLSHTRARRKATKAGARIASMPGFSFEMLDAIAADGMRMRKDARKLAMKINKNDLVRVTSPSGTDMTFKIGSKPYIDDGILTMPQSFSNLPAGELYMLPLGTEGTLVIDSFRNIITRTTEAEIRHNRMVKISGVQGKKFFKMLKGANAKIVAEFGIGLNPYASVIGKTLMDEKCMGTCHIAFGNNVSFGGTNNVPVHLDTIVIKPTIKAGSQLIMRNGKPLW